MKPEFAEVRQLKTGELSLEIEWNRRAALRGDQEAQLYLGDAYTFGRGVEEDLEKAVEWYSKSANQGNAQAQDMMSFAYCIGLGVEKDEKEGRRWRILAQSTRG